MIRALLAGLLALAAAASPARGGQRFVLAWPPSRYASAELLVWREDPAAAVDVRVRARGLDLLAAVPVTGALRVELPPGARCASGLDDCAIVVEAAAGAGGFDVALQSPSTAGVPDTLLLTAHDTLRVPEPADCGTSHVAVSWPAAAASEHPGSTSFATIVPVDGRAGITAGASCAPPEAVALELPDVLTLACGAEGDDLTGLLVASDAPVLVISGNAVATVPHAPGGGLSADLLWDVSLPLPPAGESTTWIAPPVPRAAAHAGRGDVVRVVAGGASRVRVRDDAGRDEQRILEAGQWWDLDSSGTADRTLRVDADGPVVAWHLLKSRALRGTGDAAAIALVPAQRFTTAARFAAPDGYAEGTTLLLVAEDGAAVTLDGLPVGGWIAAPGGGFLSAQVALPQPPAGAGSIHSLEGSGPFGAWIVGQGGFKAHGMVAASASAPRGVAVLRGVDPGRLEAIARTSGRTWRDAGAGPRLFFRVDEESAVLRVTRCGGDLCLAW